MEILECTLRDGSYVVDFQITKEQTSIFGGALDRVGFSYIELGHGMGLGASDLGENVAAASDKEYLIAASQSIKHARWGMFCIPSIANLDHIRLAADYGMNFVRIGIDVDGVDSSETYVKLALDLGMEVCSNFMKSYVLNPEELGILAARSANIGSKIVYLVDSAGGMMPNEVRAYIRAIRSEAPNVGIGFHGHNNLGLAVANSLICFEEDIAFIDTSLQGFGRSAGNTPTEQFISALIRSGHSPGLNPIDVMYLGETLIRPLIKKRGMSSLDIVAGQAQFHSSYMPIVLSVAERHHVEPRALIIQLCQHDKINAPIELLEHLAVELKNKNVSQCAIPWETYFGEEQSLYEP